MLARLQVRNYVLIDSLEIDFPEGLIIITGQTGAGKSILLGALSLVMSAKADASMLSEGADNCVVEAEFSVSDSDALLRTIVEDNDVEWENGQLIIRRVVNRSGRSRAFINDCPVPLAVLQELSSHLIDIHSQHQTLLLADRRFQMDTLDHYAGVSEMKSECASLWKTLQSLKAELSSVESQIDRLSADKEYNEAQYRQLEAAGVRVGELAELEEEQRQLANAEEIKSGLFSVEELFTAASSQGEVRSLDSSLKEASRILARVGKYIPAASELSQRVDQSRREIDDILSEVSAMNSRTDVSEGRLAEVEDRMSMLYDLFHKHSCVNEAELLELKDRFSEMLFDSTRLEERKEQLQREIASAQKALEDVADRIHEARMEASRPFASVMTEAVRGLELPYAVFETEISAAALSPAGRDAVSFLFSASGANPAELSKCASGGELSRIMLALKALRARYVNMPTMVFDEIDTGVSGSVADKIGSMICQMGEHMQVFAITHLPQVAAKGYAHYLVSKDIDPSTSRAVSKINRLSDEQRVMEVARMLSGSVLTDAAVQNAKSLLQG
ncbi:MAG: DNA repair protein RecN [Bacteroidales bacterium]|nr:DNA repair protein RecN [Bacteroidales bacterium]